MAVHKREMGRDEVGPDERQPNLRVIGDPEACPISYLLARIPPSDGKRAQAAPICRLSSTCSSPGCLAHWYESAFPSTASILTTLALSPHTSLLSRKTSSEVAISFAAASRARVSGNRWAATLITNSHSTTSASASGDTLDVIPQSSHDSLTLSPTPRPSPLLQSSRSIKPPHHLHLHL
jgi:hypothetical protein